MHVAVYISVIDEFEILTTSQQEEIMNYSSILNGIVTWLSARGISAGIQIAVILAVMFIALRIIRVLTNRLFIRIETISDDGLKNKADLIGTTTRIILNFIVVATAVVLLMNAVGIKSDYILNEAGAVGKGLRTLLILILMFIALKGIRTLVDNLTGMMVKNRDDEFRKRADTTGSAIQFAISVVIISFAIIMILDQFGINIGPILAAAGVVGIAVGFGAQQLVQDVIAGFFILLEDQIRVGDVIQIAGKGGVVERINLRITVLRDLSGNVHFVRNGNIDVVTNMTKEYSRYVFDIGVAYRENVDNVIEVIREVDCDLRNDPAYADDILEPMEILGLDQFADSAIIIKARTKTRPIKQWNVAREFNRRLKKRFDELDIEIPFPHVTLYPGADKTGSAAPLHVELGQRTETE